MTVLLAVVASSITLIIVRTSLDHARNDASRRAYDLAYGSARTVAEETARRFSADSLALLETVSDDEPSRICDAVIVDGEPTVVAAGQSWPAACGATWRYQETTSSTAVWLKPPTVSDPSLLVRAITTVAGTRAGVQLRLQPGRGPSPTLSSETTLDLSDLRYGAGYLDLDGLIQASGPVSVPAERLRFADSSVLTSEASFTGDLSGDARWYAPTGGVGLTGTDPRLGAPVQLTVGTLRAKHSELVAAACPNTQMHNTPTGSNMLCLESDRTLVTSAGGAVQTPSAVSAWLLLPGRSSKSSIDVFYRTGAVNLADSCPSGDTNCSLPDLAATTPGHVSTLGNWTSLGTFLLPSSGLVATDTTTHLGLCGPAGIGQASTCSTYGANTETGVTASNSFTVVVGTATTPADLYLSGPIRSGAGRIGASVSGDTLVPYWSHPVGGDLDLQLDLAVIGRTSKDLLRTLPTTPPANADNYGGSLNLRVALALARGSVNLGGFDSLSTSLTRPVAPWWSSTTGWHLESLRRLTAVEIAQSNGNIEMWGQNLTPGTVSSLSAIASSTSVTVNWIAPTAPGSGLSGYRVLYKRDADSEWTIVTTSELTLTLVGLNESTGYRIRVSALSGTGVASTPVDVSVTTS